MKKYLLFFATGIILALSSCQISNKEINDFITKNITDAEIVVNHHDSVVQAALEKGSYTKIPELSQEVSDLLTKKLTAINKLKVPATAKDYKSSAESYINSLVEIVKMQKLYSSYNDSISEQELVVLDSINIKAVKHAQVQRKIFNNCQKAYSILK